MSVAVSFVSQLLESGHVLVPAEGEWSAADRRTVGEVLAEFESSWRKELAGAPPDIDLPAAIWAAERIYQWCRLLTYRELPPELIERQARVVWETNTAAIHYSVDLTVRFLPDVVRLTQSASAEDPLLAAVIRWGSAWPLSTVGITGIELKPERIAPIVTEPVLLALYVDRILQTGDATWLDQPALRSAVVAAIGAHRELAGKLQSVLFTEPEASPA